MVKDGVTSPLAALQECHTQGSPAKEEGGQLRQAPTHGGSARPGQVVFKDNLDKFSTPRWVERPSFVAPDRSAHQDWDEITYPLFCFLRQGESGNCGRTIASQGGGSSKFCIGRSCAFTHANKAWASLLPVGSYVQDLDKHALFDPMLPLKAAEHDSGSVVVLGETFTQEIWASIFRQLMDQGKDGTVGSRELLYLAATLGRKATPMHTASKRGRDNDSTGESGEDQGEDITKILRCIRQVKGSWASALRQQHITQCTWASHTFATSGLESTAIWATSPSSRTMTLLSFAPPRPRPRAT